MRVLTASARRSRTVHGTAHTFERLRRAGWSDAAVYAQLDARRWQRHGRVIVTHAGPPTASELRAIALLNCGPRAALTAPPRSSDSRDGNANRPM